jgi:hypothetical protein
VLTFVDRHAVAAPAETDRDAPWIDRAAMSAWQRAQLLGELRLFDAAYDETLFDLPYRALPDSFRGLFECPLEWWRVVDENNALQYTLFLWGCDGGVLFIGASAVEVCDARIMRGAFYGDGWEGDKPDSLAQELEEAQSEIDPSLHCELRSVAFVNR